MPAARLPILAAALMLAASAAGGRAATEVDLALVLAVDVSGSIDLGEHGLQRNGYVAALRHPDLIRAIRARPRGRIAVSYFEWSGRPHSATLVPWAVIDGPEAAEGFAAAIAALPAQRTYGTSISRALDFGAALLEEAPAAAARRVIDVSGDGPNNVGPPGPEARDRVVAAGITINGLPLTLRPSPTAPDIARYFEDCVIGGEAAFIVPATGEDRLFAAILRKLVLEIGAFQPARLWRASAGPADCLAGEKARDATGLPYFPGLYE